MTLNNTDAALIFNQENILPWFNANSNDLTRAMMAMTVGMLAVPGECIEPRKPLLNFSLINMSYEGLAEFDSDIEIDSATYNNGTSLQQTFTFSANKQATDTFTYGFTEGVKIGITSGADVAIAGCKVTGEFSFGASQTITATKSRSWTITQSVVVPSNSTTKVSATFKQRQVSGQFIATYAVSLTGEGLKFTNNQPFEIAFPGMNCQLITKGWVSGLGGVDINVSLKNV